MVLKNSNQFFFIIIPILFLGVNLSLVSLFFSPQGYFFIEMEYGFLFIIFIELLNIILILIIGVTTKNKYAIIASSRSINFYIITDIVNMAFFTLIYKYTNSFSLSDLKFYDITLIGKFFLIMPIIILILLMNTHKSPFDIIEAETEIIMGYHLEYSGFWFGIFVLVEYIHIFIFSFLMALII